MAVPCGRMAGAAAMTKARSARATEVPLYLIPRVIGRMILDRGGKVYRISVCRTHYHHYNVSVRTRALPKELRPAQESLPVTAEITEESS
jgi:hypothetical protein